MKCDTAAKNGYAESTDVLNVWQQVFFRAGVLGQMEELRDDRLSKIVSWLQSWVRGYLSRKEFKKLQDQRLRSLNGIFSDLELFNSTLYSLCIGWLCKWYNATCANTFNSAPGHGGSCGRRLSPCLTSPALRMRSR